MKFFTTSNSKNIIATLRIVTIEKSELTFLKPWIKRRKNLGFYESLLAELRLEDEYDFNILFTNDFWKFWRNILADKRWHNSREYYNKRTNPAQTITCSHKWLSINMGTIHELCLWVLFFLLNYEQFNMYFFLSFRLINFSFSNQLPDFLLPTKTSYKTNKSPDLSSIHYTRFFFKIIQHCET